MCTQYISDFKNLNVKFNIIKEKQADNIMACEYSYSRLREISEIFDKYRTIENQGKFVNLEFAQIYFLSAIDEELSHILMRICLETELKIKTVLLNDAEKINVSEKFLHDYINSDYEYLALNYAKEIDKFLDNDTNDRSLYNFLDMVLFGTFERLVHEFYKQYAPLIYKSECAPFEQYLNSLHFIRNKVAHNNCLLSELNVKKPVKNLKIKGYLESKGLGIKTINTNLSKPVVFDICNLLHLYCQIQNETRISRNYKELRRFVRKIGKYKKYFKNNEDLKSVYNFFKQTVYVYSKRV